MHIQPEPKLLDVREVLKLIDQGNQNIASKRIKENAVLVLGRTGVGKGTLTKYIVGEKLIATEEAGNFSVKSETSNSGISSSVVQSDTFCPNILTAENISYIDCPGFGDSRGAEFDIAESFFRKKIIDNVTQVKILLVISCDSILSTDGRGEGLRKAFESLYHIFDINSNNIEKISKSICVVINRAGSDVISSIQSDLLKQSEKKAKLEKKKESLEENLRKKFEGEYDKKGGVEEKLVEKLNKVDKRIKKNQEGTDKKEGELQVKLQDLHSKIKSALENFASESTAGSTTAILEHIIKESNVAIFSKPSKVGAIAGRKHEILL